MKIAIGGSTGMVGTELVSFLTTGGHDVVRLVRGEVSPDGDDAGDDAQKKRDAMAQKLGFSLPECYTSSMLSTTAAPAISPMNISIKTLPDSG